MAPFGVSPRSRGTADIWLWARRHYSLVNVFFFLEVRAMVLQFPTFWVGAPAFQNIHHFLLQQPCCWSTGEERMRSSEGKRKHLAMCPTPNAIALVPHHSLHPKGLQYAWRMQLFMSQCLLPCQITQVEFVISKVKLFPTDLIILRCYKLPRILKGIIMWLFVCCHFLPPFSW